MDTVFGPVTPAICRTCEQAAKERALLANTRNQRRRQAETLRTDLNDVIPRHYHRAHIRHLPKALKETVMYSLHDFDGRGMLLWGPVGTGKTYTLCVMARWFIMQGEIVLRYRYDSLLLKLRQTYHDSTGQSDADIIEQCTTADRFILEDIGSGAAIDSAESDFSVRTLLSILDDRVEAERATYFTSNKPIEALQNSFNECIASRIIGTCEIVKLNGKDRRRAK